MSTYVVDSTGTTINTGIRVTQASGLETHQTTRSFYRVDLTSSGYTVDDIDNVTIRYYCAATTGGGLPAAKFFCGSSGDNWGTALLGNITVFTSTEAYLESTMPITTTGFFWIPINKTHLDYNGMNWFKWTAGATESTYNVVTTINCSFASQNNSTVSFRPMLILYFKNGGSKQYSIICDELSYSMDCKYIEELSRSGLLSNNYNGDSSDGFVRKVDVIAQGDPYDPGAET